MCKAEYIIRHGNPDSQNSTVYLNHKEAQTILYLFLYGNEEKVAEKLEESIRTTETRIYRLYERCGIECPEGENHRNIEQLKHWALCKKVVACEDGEYFLTSYHKEGAGRQLELEFEF